MSPFFSCPFGGLRTPSVTPSPTSERPAKPQGSSRTIIPAPGVLLVARAGGQGTEKSALPLGATAVFLGGERTAPAWGPQVSTGSPRPLWPVSRHSQALLRPSFLAATGSSSSLEHIWDSRT